jgi:hypothetical protein
MAQKSTDQGIQIPLAFFKMYVVVAFERAHLAIPTEVLSELNSLFHRLDLVDSSKPVII